MHIKFLNISIFKMTADELDEMLEWLDIVV